MKFKSMKLKRWQALKHFKAESPPQAVKGKGAMGCKSAVAPPNMVLELMSFGKRPLVAPYCAIPRDYLSDTPLLRAMGFLVSQDGQLGAIPPPSFLSVSPLESMRSGGAIPPSQKGYLSDTCAIPYENKANGCDTPSAMLSRKGIARYGGVSRTGSLRRDLCSTMELRTNDVVL